MSDETKCDYFQLKYLITESFYSFILDEHYTAGQAIGRTFYACFDKEEIENLILYATLLELATRYEEKENLNYYLEDYEKMIDILNRVNLDDCLNGTEKEFILDDISAIKCVFDDNYRNINGNYVSDENKWSFFESKYLTVEFFYSLILDEHYTVGQAIGRNFAESFEYWVERGKEGIDTLTLYATLLELATRYEEKEKLNYYLEDYEKMIDMLNRINLDDCLNETEKRFILDDISAVKRAFDKITK